MSGFRQVHSKMWGKDKWFLDVEPLHKLLFIYLFTNEAASFSGLYELPLKVMEFETGLTKEVIEEGFDYFSSKDKAYYDEETSVVWVVNMPKYHTMKSPPQKKKVLSDLALVPYCHLLEQCLERNGIDMRELKPQKDNAVRPLSDSKPDLMVGALARVTGWDYNVPSIRASMQQTAVNLAKYQPEEIIKRYSPDGDWYDEETGHWKGKKGDPPTLTDITTTIGMHQFSRPPAEPIRKDGNNSRTGILDAINEEEEGEELPY